MSDIISPSYCTLYFVRHGETVWNVQRKIQGSMDSPLTEKGVLQAKDLAEKLKGISFDAVFASPAGRAQATAGILAEEKKLAILTATALRERGWGRFEGALRDEMNQHIAGLSLKYEDLLHHPDGKPLLGQFGIEHNEDVVARVLTFVREVAVGYAGKTVLIVTHGGVMHSLLLHFDFAPFERMPLGSVGNAAFIKLRSDGVDLFLDQVEGVSARDASRSS